MKRFNRGSVIPAVLLAFLTVTCSAMADDCDPPPAATKDDGPIQWVPTHREASGNCFSTSTRALTRDGCGGFSALF